MKHNKKNLVLTVLFFGALLVTGCVKNKATNTSTVPIKTNESVNTNVEVMKKTNSVTADDQEIIDGKIIIAKVVSDAPGWLIIHSDNNNMPGPVIGQVYVQKGENINLPVELDIPKITPKLFAMLHVDAGGIGIYEFPGVDAPVKDGDTIVMDDFQSTSVMKKGATGPAMEKKTDAVMEKKETTEIPPAMKEFTMTAKKWEFSPATITVNKGDKVKLSIQNINTDQDHGFIISDFNVNKKLVSGQTTVVEFTADKTGTFTFSCNVFCGAGHSDMRGTLIVK